MAREHKMFEILSILERSSRPLTSKKITEELDSVGIRITERMVRNYLQELDKKGFTENLYREGRKITELGRRELRQGNICCRSDFLFDKITRMITETRFDIHKRSGHVIVNLSLIDEKNEQKTKQILEKVCSSGLFSPYIRITYSGEKICGREVPEEKICLATVSSITIDQIILKNGIYSIPTYTLLLEIRDNKPTRCTNFISPLNCSFDPAELLISKRLSSVYAASTEGRGNILANYSEVPHSSRLKAINILKESAAILGGKFIIGRPGAEHLGLLTKPAYSGLFIFCGISLPAALEECGIRTETETIAGAINFSELQPITEVKGEVITL